MEQMIIDRNYTTAEDLMNEERAVAGLPPIGIMEAVEKYEKEVAEAIRKVDSSAAANKRRERPGHRREARGGYNLL